MFSFPYLGKSGRWMLVSSLIAITAFDGILSVVSFPVPSIVQPFHNFDRSYSSSLSSSRLHSHKRKLNRRSKNAKKPIVSATISRESNDSSRMSSSPSPQKPRVSAVKELVTNLFSVCAHLQNPDLYVPQWADHAVLIHSPSKAQNFTLVSSRPLQEGEIISLYPIDVLGLRTLAPSSQNEENLIGSNAKQLDTSKKKMNSRDFIVFDVNKHGKNFKGTSQPSFSGDKQIPSIPLTFLEDGVRHDEQLFIDVAAHPVSSMPGWMGHLATKVTKPRKNDILIAANCAVVPLPGASPLCALVAIKHVPQGQELVLDSTPTSSGDDNQKLVDTLSVNVGEIYAKEIYELASYLKMSYQGPLEPFERKVQVVQDDRKRAGTENSANAFESQFHAINLEYPGLRHIHRDPDILVVDNFLSDEECDRITNNAKSHMIPCVIKHPVTGIVQEDPSRTSTNANMPQSDVPSIVDKIVELTNCQDKTHLETLQILRYTSGQTFYPHTDGFDGPTTACGFEASGRLVTIFCYLNDVHEGGETRFTNLDLKSSRPTSHADKKGAAELLIAPRKGTAVLHFPTNINLEEDIRTEHEGCPAVDEKWLLVTWAWKDARTDAAYGEDQFPSIMG